MFKHLVVCALFVLGISASTNLIDTTHATYSVLERSESPSLHKADITERLMSSCAAQVRTAQNRCSDLCGAAGVVNFTAGVCGVGSSCTCGREVAELPQQ